MWWCLCDCGKTLIVRAQHLRNGNTKSCGCWDADVLAARSTKHGLYGTPAYETWKGMVQRCTNSANREWPNYGGRGITVCEAWREFAQFHKDMGDRPPGQTLDRKNNALGYDVINCRWATSQEQGSNRRTNRWITYAGKTQTLTAWAIEFGIRPSALYKKIAQLGEQAGLDDFQRLKGK